MNLESLYRRIIHNSVRHGLIVIDLDWTIMVMNKAAEVILSEQESVIKKPLTELGLCPEIENALIGATTGLTFSRKQSQLDRGGRSIFINWDAVPLIEDNGDISGAILLFEDITEALSLSRQLKEWERLATAGEVAAGLAHEIRNPLAAAQGALQLFELTEDEDERRELLTRFSDEMGRMNRILSEFLILVEPPVEDELISIDLTKVVKEIRLLVKSEALLYNVELLIIPCPGELKRVSGNSNRLKQVLLNIAKNALEAMTNGGRLTLSLGQDDASVWVQFRDEGPGIPLEHQDNIFRPFFTTKVGGTGLGLAISQRIIKHMDGEIKMLSAPGDGTTVTVTLPIWRHSNQEESNE